MADEDFKRIMAGLQPKKKKEGNMLKSIKKSFSEDNKEIEALLKKLETKIEGIRKFMKEIDNLVNNPEEDKLTNYIKNKGVKK